MLIGAEIAAELVLVQDLGHFGQNRYMWKYRSRAKVNFKHLRYQPMGAINIVWPLENFPYHLTLVKTRSFGPNRKVVTNSKANFDYPSSYSKTPKHVITFFIIFNLKMAKSSLSCGVLWDLG